MRGFGSVAFKRKRNGTIERGLHSLNWLHPHIHYPALLGCCCTDAQASPPPPSHTCAAILAKSAAASCRDLAAPSRCSKKTRQRSTSRALMASPKSITWGTDRRQVGMQEQLGV